MACAGGTQARPPPVYIVWREIISFCALPCLYLSHGARRPPGPGSLPGPPRLQRCSSDHCGPSLTRRRGNCWPYRFLLVSLRWFPCVVRLYPKLSFLAPSLRLYRRAAATTPQCSAKPPWAPPAGRGGYSMPRMPTCKRLRVPIVRCLHCYMRVTST